MRFSSAIALTVIVALASSISAMPTEGYTADANHCVKPCIYDSHCRSKDCSYNQCTILFFCIAKIRRTKIAIKGRADQSGSYITELLGFGVADFHWHLLRCMCYCFLLNAFDSADEPQARVFSNTCAKFFQVLKDVVTQLAPTNVSGFALTTHNASIKAAFIVNALLCFSAYMAVDIDARGTSDL
ncbi:uncharacterized protein HD556DRAFT_1302439 [Suillus plorans]|uniref:Uncharacterized protein n=1 Tax=Suillus plorans TaxID=116603 RepID=A0A9P7J9M7_9AGAM|nr:uncharacterized protein HD556DRAFT_1302439 [Suillus plorans]KAG1810048.1 hypothetical protein HD556DRAFT_1302439 [Suillus plorans]